MTTSDNRPNPFVTVWAEDGEKFKTIPELKNDRDKLDDEGNSIHKARATMEEGFPEITMKSAMRGGVPPWGKDHNKILNQITEAIRWFQAGGTAIYDDKLCKKIGGYPEGTILQSSISEDFQVLWFSEAKNNMNNPDTTPSPGNGWVKVDFKDLETRITKNTNDIAALNESKAEKNGSCLTPFKASIMQASQYKFCNPDKTGNGYITQEDKQVKIYSDEHTHFCFPSFNNVNPDRPEISPDYVPTDSAFTLGYDPKGKVTTSYFPATNSFFNGGWIHMQSVLSVENSLTQFTFKNFKAAKGSNKAKDYISWQIAVDSSPKDPEQSQGTENPSEMKGDFLLTTSSTLNYRKDQLNNTDAAEVIGDDKTKTDDDTVKVGGSQYRLRISHENGDMFVFGAYRNGNSDLAEYYQTDRSDYEPGTLMCHGFDTEAILCQSIDQSDDFFGVISTQPAYIMNGHRQENKNYVLIALNGKVPVKVKGIVKCGDKITIGQDGYGVVSINKNDVIVGRAKENKVTEEVGLVSCYVQAHM